MISPTADKRLISILQSGFPLVEKPYHAIGRILGFCGEEIIESIIDYRKTGLVREISAIINPRTLGYNTTLAALQLPEQNVELCKETINKHPYISHAYLRNHLLNLWITLAVNQKQNIDEELEKIRRACNGSRAINLPALKLFKLKAVFDETNADYEKQTQAAKMETYDLSTTQKQALIMIQQDLPVLADPFRELAEGMNLSTKDFLSIVKELVKKGIIKRYGANINHRHLGYHFNAMICFSIDERLASSLGRYLSSQKQVSHCYLRKPHELFEYNLFAMAHCNDEDSYDAFMKMVVDETGQEKYLGLKSVGEIKKKRNCYLP